MLDLFEPPGRFFSFDAEAAHSRCFFEDEPPFFGRRLQDGVDLALFDDAVGAVRHADVGQQVADVAQAAGLPIDEVFAFAAAIDAAGDLDLGGVVVEDAGAIVEDQRRFGGVRCTAGTRTAEDDVGHLLAAKGFDALGAEDPLDGVDDVRLARAVRPDDDGDAGRELEPGPLREALETVEFEGGKHGGNRLVANDAAGFGYRLSAASSRPEG